jgi:hypothetical protein
MEAIVASTPVPDLYTCCPNLNRCLNRYAPGTRNYFSTAAAPPAYSDGETP